MKFIAIMITAIVLAGCGGREAHPVAASSPGDAVASCPVLLAEHQANVTQITSKSNERASNNGKNAIAGAAGALVFPPSLFFVDLKSYEKAEIDALEARNQVLQGLIWARHC
ncbi:MAG: hypothetical protein KF735_15435 [Chelatococcus sp.]|uniref:hypothetical protein n=1 Tax=Chelatococcus sp. TaxID=1953771 RepID=UPI0025C608F7|nr:hypothetical protein [Chelatococcus sp.]MBX3539034.1 hypothetical protein [Chelatococcus sp.]